MNTSRLAAFLMNLCWIVVVGAAVAHVLTHEVLNLAMGVLVIGAVLGLAAEAVTRKRVNFRVLLGFVLGALFVAVIGPILVGGTAP